MCFILYMLCESSLFKSLCERFGSRCGRSVVVISVHSCFSSVILRWKSSTMLLRCMSPAVFIRNNVRVIGDLMQFCCLILGMSLAPPALANMCCIRPL